MFIFQDLFFFFKKNFKYKIKQYDNAIFTQFAHAYKKNNYIPSPWYNFDNLTKNKNKLWCFLYVKTNEFKDLSELKKIFSKNNSLNYMFIQGLGSFKLIFKTLQTYTLFAINYFLIDEKKLFEVNKIDFSDIFYKDFQKSFLGSESIKNISNYYFIKEFQQKYNCKNIFYLFEGQPHEKCLNYFLKNKSKLIGFAHSSIRKWHLSYFNYLKEKKNWIFEPHYICLSRDRFNFTKKMNFNSKIIDVEPIRFFDFRKKNLQTNKAKKKTVLIIGDILEENTLRLIKLINKYKLKNKSKLYYFKPHIAININQSTYKGLKLINKDIDEILNKFDYFICSSSTTAGIIPFKFNKKILFFKDSEILNLNPINNLPRKILFSNLEELSKKIDHYEEAKNINKYKSLSLNKWINFLEKL